MVPTAEATTPPDDDSDLMQRVQGGDEFALGVLMRRWERPVKSVIARLIFNARETEDLAQETFVRVWHGYLRSRLTWHVTDCAGGAAGRK